MTTPTQKLRLIGHDYVVIKKLAKGVYDRLPHGTMVTKLAETLDGRGFSFDVQVTDKHNRPTGHVARVQVSLDRFETG
jgi:hypothetical protein